MMQAALHYKGNLFFAFILSLTTLQVKIVLVHDQATCSFPGPHEQPQYLSEVFHDKAITFMSQYTSHCSRQILKKVDINISQFQKTYINFVVQ